jgi:hypothetical protein
MLKFIYNFCYYVLSYNFTAGMERSTDCSTETSVNYDQVANVNGGFFLFKSQKISGTVARDFWPLFFFT